MAMGKPSRMVSLRRKKRYDYAMSLPVATTINWHGQHRSAPPESGIARYKKTFSESEMQELRDRCKQDAADRRYGLTLSYR